MAMFYDVETLDRGLVMIPFSFKCVVTGGAAVPITVADHALKGVGFAAVKTTNTGEYTITLNDTYDDYVSFILHLQQNAAGDQIPQVRSYSSGVITLAIIDISGGADADPAIHANTRLNGVLIMKNTSV